MIQILVTINRHIRQKDEHCSSIRKKKDKTCWNTLSIYLEIPINKQLKVIKPTAFFLFFIFLIMQDSKLTKK